MKYIFKQYYTPTGHLCDQKTIVNANSAEEAKEKAILLHGSLHSIDEDLRFELEKIEVVKS